MKRILLVEDDVFISDLISTKLTEAGYAVEVAPTGEAAIEKSADNFDAILLDIKLPDASGVDVLSSFKGSDTSKQQPVIVFSNIDDADIRNQCLELGAHAFLVKYDTDLDHLVSQVEHALAP